MTRSESNDELHPAHCAICNALIGQHVVSLDPAHSGTSFVRILKYATYPVGSTPPLGEEGAASTSQTGQFTANGLTAPAASAPTTQAQAPGPVKRYSLAAHLTAEMLELGQAHACHRFVIEDAEDERVRLLLWLFNPAVRVSFSTSSPTNAILAEPSASSSSASSSPRTDTEPAPTASSSSRGGETRQLARTMNAVKVFYTRVHSDSDEQRDPAVRAFVENEHSTTESLAYPREVVNKLADLLRASSAVYPRGKRVWGEMQAGFLERI